MGAGERRVIADELDSREKRYHCKTMGEEKVLRFQGRAGNDWNLSSELANCVIVIGQENAGEKDGGG